MCACLCTVVYLSAFVTPSYAEPGAAHSPTTLRVGPERTLKLPSEAARLARAGDTVEIDAGLYLNDYAQWNQANLTIRGMGGMAHLQSTELIPNGKAIWIVSGDNTLIENVEFSGARVADTNGAGIRHRADMEDSRQINSRKRRYHRDRAWRQHELVVSFGRLFPGCDVKQCDGFRLGVHRDGLRARADVDRELIAKELRIGDQKRRLVFDHSADMVGKAAVCI
jgi:hypothetical protein